MSDPIIFHFSVIRDGDKMQESKSTFFLLFDGKNSYYGKAAEDALREISGKIFEIEKKEKIWADSNISVSRQVDEYGRNKFFLNFSNKEFIQIEINSAQTPIVIKVLPIGKISKKID